jgi:hypothetical protein
MISRLTLGLLLLACHTFALTTISDNLMKPDGTPCTGNLAISWQAFPPGTINVPVGVQAPGNFIAQLQPGTYTVVFQLQSGCTMANQIWIICNTTAVLNMAQAQAGVCAFPVYSSPESGAVWTVSGATHGLGCAVLVVPKDVSGNVLNWPSINVAPAGCAVTVSFGQSVTGTLEIQGGGQIFPFSALSTITVPESKHGIQSSSILIGAYDFVTGNLVDGASNVNPTTYLVSDVFGSPQNVNLVIIGSTGSAVFPFHSTATPVVTQAQHGYATAILFPGVTDLLGNLLDPLININGSNFSVTSTFAMVNSGNTVILQ